jgi:hypothetical protein
VLCTLGSRCYTDSSGVRKAGCGHVRIGSLQRARDLIPHVGGKCSQSSAPGDGLPASEFVITRSSRHGILVDIFFLRTVQPNERLDGLDDALGIADQIAIGILGAKPKGRALKKPCQMLDFPVGAAHGGKPRGIGKLSRKPRIDPSLVFAFVRDDGFLRWLP